jgi:hypothetical protein
MFSEQTFMLRFNPRNRGNYQLSLKADPFIELKEKIHPNNINQFVASPFIEGDLNPLAPLAGGKKIIPSPFLGEGPVNPLPL